MHSNVVWTVLEFVAFTVITIGLNVAARARRRRGLGRQRLHDDPINPWMPDSQNGGHRHGHDAGGGHHHGSWGGDGGHHGGGGGGAPGGHHG